MMSPGVLLNARYRVIRPIGGGGFGKIFEVDDGGITKVLKVLSKERFHSPVIQDKAIALFRREAEVLSRLVHPGIPRVDPDGYFTCSVQNSYHQLHCLVMEKILGSNLEEWLRARGSQPITAELAISWLSQLAEILQLLHQRQYFHRDIKPSNIMLKPDGQLVLIDFGAVREVTTSYLQKQQGDETGTVIISAGYTPSEQAEGHAVPQSDFFALGRSFVYLLTGKSPLDFPKKPETGELVWREQATLVSPHLADLIDRLMAPFPGQRPQNSQEILQYLAQIPKNSPTGLREFLQRFSSISSPTPRRRTPRERLPHSRIFQFVLSALVLLVSTPFLWTLPPAIADNLNDTGWKNYEKGRLYSAEFYYRLALIFDSKMPEYQYNLGLVYEDQKKIAQARAVYEIAAQKDFDKAYNNLARLDILDKKYTQAVSLLQKSLSLVEDNETKYTILKNLGWAQMELGHYQEALTNLQEAINLFHNKAPAFCFKAQVLQRQGNQQASVSDWKNCMKYGDPQNSDERVFIRLALANIK